MITFYLIMPVPTSQQKDRMELGYFLYHSLWYARVSGTLLMLPFLIQTWRSDRSGSKILVTGFIALGLLVVYALGFWFTAENVFREPKQLIFAGADKNTVPENNYVLGVEMNGESKAYPLKYVGYHHKIQDVVGGTSVLVTYCTLCRSGMVYDPIVNGNPQQFRLVGVAFNNAIFEDEATKSWWYQFSGIAGAGPLKGTAMKVLPYSQMTLSSWIQQHPNTLIMQPDPNFTKEYAKLKNYDLNIPTANTDPAKNKSFMPNSWIVGVVINDSARAFLWNHLTEKKVMNEIVNHQPLLLALEPDNYSFHVWERTVNDTALTFSLTSNAVLTDLETASTWNWKGECISGHFSGKRLVPVAAYQTFYHSWERFFGNRNSDAPYSIHHNKFFQPLPEVKN